MLSMDNVVFLYIVDFMVKTKQGINIQKRHWAIILLSAAIIVTNLVWYHYYQTQQQLNKAYWTDFLTHQIEINKLQSCINDNTRPCAITPQPSDLKDTEATPQ